MADAGDAGASAGDGSRPSQPVRMRTELEDASTGEVSRRVYLQNAEKNLERVAKLKLAKNNQVRTSKYTFWNLSFIAVNLFEQFHRFANVYFLFIIILSSIPVISAIPPYTTAFPLFLVLSATLAKDSHDDLGRHKSDKMVNNREVFRLRNKAWVKCKWFEVLVGDIVKVMNDEMIPADLFLISSSNDANEAYVETAELDGETNLKRRLACTATQHLKTEEELSSLNGEFVCEPPNTNLEKLNGTYYLESGSTDKKASVSNEQVLLRGCTLRNTDFAVGLAIYVGPETKQMQNSGPLKRKTTTLDAAMNDIVLTIFVLLLSLCGLCAIINSVWQGDEGRDFNDAYNFYNFDNGNNTGFADLGNLRNDNQHYVAFLSLWLYFILLSQLVPISLYVSVEFIRLGQSLLIDWDGDMYSEEFNTPAVARSTALSDQLGQIDYVFSDKTGTLTQNVMTFNSCHIGGRSYEPDEGTEMCAALKELVGGDDAVSAFFRLLAVCHTVQVEEKNGQIAYQAASPDEKALVEGAQAYGVSYLTDANESVRINFRGKEESFERLHVLEFDSTRKRMSVIVRSDEGRYFIMSKGADSIMMPLLSEESRNTNDAWRILDQSLTHYSEMGLRTLVLAQREFTKEEYEDWNRRYHDAETAEEGRDKLKEDLQAEVEIGLTLLGATAIEDKLQVGVPETIQKIKDGGVKLWVLTGDKRQTAINIGYSCKLLNHTTMKDPLIVEPIGDPSNPFAAVRRSLEAQNRRIKSWFSDRTESGDPFKFGMVVDGPTLTYILTPTQDTLDTHPDFQADSAKQRAEIIVEQKANAKLFLKLAAQCTSVICCRVSPLQKAALVKAVKQPFAPHGPYKLKEPLDDKVSASPTTLAIGDGANDVSMIREAHIGVGISGLEGRQAVLASDYSFAQFRFLQRLLLVHGRWSYMRMCIFLRYFFYKSASFSLCHLLFAFHCGASGLTVYDPLYTSMYNVVFTSLPVMFVAIFEQDVTAEASLKFPILYEAGPRNVLFNFYSFVHSMARGFYHSLLLFYLLYIGILGGGAINSDGEIQSDYYTFGMLLSASLTIIANLQLGLEIRYWTWLVAVSMLVGPIGYLGLTALEYEVDSPFGDGVEFVSPYFDTYDRCFSGSLFWKYFFLVIALTVLPELLIQLFQEYVLYTPIDTVREHYLLRTPGVLRTIFNKDDVEDVQKQTQEMEKQEQAEAQRVKAEMERKKSFRHTGVLEPRPHPARPEGRGGTLPPLSPPTQISYI